MAKVSAQQIAEICEMRERGLTFGQIALKTGIHKETVNWHCTRNAADPPGARPLAEDIVGPAVMKRGDHIVRRFTPDEDRQILAMRQRGMRPADIARKIERKPHSVAGRLITLARKEQRRESAAQGGTP
ncbi:hypothetical protein [Hyphobacterium sp.]|uniref:hypothetical protein n=1 Tax=Hyphobacterium sp. TaxID=2004662 RepID=UPI003BAB2CC8